IRRHHRLPRRRWDGCGRLSAIADQLAIIVADITDTVRHVESRQLLAASIGSKAERGQGRPLHSEIAAALLIRARRQTLSICRKGRASQEDTREHTHNDPHLGLLSGSMLATTVTMAGKVPARGSRPPRL